MTQTTEQARTLYECAACKHLYRERPSSCDCFGNAKNEYATLVAVPHAIFEFVKSVAEQKSEKPDYWSSCGQCERNISDAEDLLPTPPEA